MKAFRNVGGNIVEIEVDIGLDSLPILPPDTTVNARPAAQEGHYVTVVGNEWVQIPIPVPFVTFETKKQQKLSALQEYRGWYLDQPVEHNTIMFDADETARARLTQALTINMSSGYLPPAWITYDNSPFVLTVVDDLKNLVNTIQAAFSSRFFEMDTIRQQILAAADEAALNAVVVPVRPNQI